ncbi:MAG: hypothetical protein WCA78_05415 [Rhizomicrobium sp.]|jgi:hypothetical protein
MRKPVKKPRVKRAPAKENAHSTHIPKRNLNEVGGKTNPPLEKLLHDTYARRACHL